MFRQRAVKLRRGPSGTALQFTVVCAANAYTVTVHTGFKPIVLFMNQITYSYQECNEVITLVVSK